MRIYRALVLLFLVSISLSTRMSEDDQVYVNIPGYNLKFYSGYLPIPDKNIHYQFFPSQNNPSRDPLLIWLAGDPGESALLTCYYENGPFVLKYGIGNFKVNEFAWNKKANLLFLELPAGTGFTNRTGDLKQDVFVADALNAIQMFLKRNPIFYGNEVYLTGRGYGGVHVAYLAKQIILYNIIQIASINLKGILVGNPCVNADQCYPSGSQKYSSYHYQFLNQNGVFEKEDWKQYEQNCQKDTYDFYRCYIQRKNLDSIFNFSNISIYNINQKCSKDQIGQFNYLNAQCEDVDGLYNFLNDKAVRRVWNIIDTNEWVPYQTQVFEWYWGQDQNSYKFYPFLIENGLRIWVYSGESDSYIPTISTQKWVEQLADELVIPIVENWKNWQLQDQTGGRILKLRDLTLVTVKDGGFRTGIDRPNAMVKIVEAFLIGGSLGENTK